jgi:3-phenylpropionate/cinnamic acid dioxygenase small subunit
MNIEHVIRVADLNARYADAIDADRLEAWPDFFLDDGRYRITTAENVAQGLPVSIIYAASRAMMRDRVSALREANVYEDQRYRHVLGSPLVIPPPYPPPLAGEGREGVAVEGREGAADGALRARTSFMVARVMRTGETIVFATGCYEDRVVLGGSGEAHFAEKTVVIDSRQIDTLLAIPL